MPLFNGPIAGTGSSAVPVMGERGAVDELPAPTLVLVVSHRHPAAKPLKSKDVASVPSTDIRGPRGAGS